MTYSTFAAIDPSVLESKPSVGDHVQLDEGAGGNLAEDDGFSDSSFPGCQFRFISGHGWRPKLAVNVALTGKPRYLADSLHGVVARCKVEFVGDGEPSSFAAGWIRFLS